MKQGKIFGKLAQDKRVLKISFGEKSATVFLADGFYSPVTVTGVPSGKKAIVSNAREANLFVKNAIRVPTPREGYRIVTNLMSGLPVEERIDTPYACSVASESYWSN